MEAFVATFVLPLADQNATLETVGGKGMSLAKMSRAGLPVPGGFHITTEAYCCFIKENGIQPRLLVALQGVDSADPASLERISQYISAYFTEGTIPPEISAAIAAAYAGMPAIARGATVAVRSSATAEDLPGASFAGQQDTYLNICGTDELLLAVKNCWASLWTARAMGYRARQGIAPDCVALAVVVQELVFADASGVLFTANPVSGMRHEMMITTTWGLGEALVGGLVTPDTLIIDKASGNVIRRETGEKRVMTVRAASGTHEQPVPKHLIQAPVLSDAQATELATLGREIERLYSAPMDVEWTLAGGRFAIVQARPITSRLETVDSPIEGGANNAVFTWTRSNPKVTMSRGSFAEFVPNPVSPLFATLALPIAQDRTQKMFGEFLGISMEGTHPFEVINGYVYNGLAIPAKMIWKALSLAPIGTSIRLMRAGRQRWAVARARIFEVVKRWQGDLKTLTASELLTSAREIFDATADYYTVGQSGPIPLALVSELGFSRFYNTLVKGKTDPEPSVFLLGFDTLPLRAEKSLYDLSLWVKGQRELADYVLQTPTEAICKQLYVDPIPSPLVGPFVERFTEHLSRYGHTLYSLDFANPVPVDDPAPIVEVLKAYLAGNGADPYKRQRAQVSQREQAAQAICQRLDPLRRKWFTRLLQWAQACVPDREDCIADLGLGYPQLRKLLTALGQRLADCGVIVNAEDVYWLEAQELERFAASLEKGAPLVAYVETVADRRAYWRRVRGITPPMALPENSWMGRLLAHDNPQGSILKGYPASAGVVTARACVLRGPDEFGKMRSGDVIVAVTTTPAWTPLFAMASGVVTDIGGPLSHSSIVAREYGIPAVMATGVASKRIQHGQMIKIDGTNGTVTLLVE